MKGCHFSLFLKNGKETQQEVSKCVMFCLNFPKNLALSSPLDLQTGPQMIGRFARNCSLVAYFGPRKEPIGGQTRQMIGYDEDKRGSQNNHAIHTEKVVADRKIFFLDLKENDRGQFVKITEDVRGRRDTIMVPAEVLGDFIDALQAVEEAAEGEE